jgi:HTH-type transcriptional regulator/antitoxin HigA
MEFLQARALRTEAEYDAALAAVRPLIEADPDPASDDGARLEALVLLIEAYERVHYPMGPVEPRELLKFAMDSNGHSQSDLADLLGSRSRASEILSGKRDLTLDQIRLLAREWHIPAGALVGELAA